jgi:hypothetical protein
MDLGEERDEEYSGGGWPARPLGPDDDPDFLLEIERRIRESRDDR